MRFHIIRLAAAVIGVAALASCDTGPVTPKFGNGIAGGTTGTTPVTPPNPNTPDTGGVDGRILEPATTGQLVNVGDSLLVQVRAFDDRQVQSIRIQGMKYTGDADLGTLVQTIRYPTVFIPGPSGPPFRAGLTDTTVRRYLKPAVPVDSSLDSLVIMAIVTDAAGNVDTTTRRVNLVSGPSLTVLAPNAGDQVPQNVPMNFSVRVQSNAGVRTVRVRVQGESTWPPTAALDTTYNDTIAGVQRDVTISHTKLIPANAPVGGRITITATATDLTGNPGSAAPRVVSVRQLGTTAPRVTQIIPDRMEITDSITVIANGDGIVNVGFRIRDLSGALLKDTIVALGTVTSNVRRNIRIALSSTHQGKSVRVSTFATDQLNVRGFSIANATSPAQTDSLLAHSDSSLIVYGQTFALPRSGIVGDLQVDTIRSRVLISNMNANRLEVWQNAVRAFDVNGVAVGSQPWGMTMSVHPDTLLVANSGGTNLSRVYLGPVAGPVSSMAEDLPRRIRTRTNFIFTISESFDNANAVHYAVSEPLIFSDRPQYIGQLKDTIVYFSTKPTEVAPLGTVRYLDPRQPFPEQRTFAFIDDVEVQNFNFLDIDSLYVREAGTGQPDTIYLFDHLPGTNLPSMFVKAPTCNASGVTIAGRANCIGGTTDPRYDARFPSGLPQGARIAFEALFSAAASCAPNCSDGTLLENAQVRGITDTTFVAVSADRNWIAFGNGNAAPGQAQVFMCRATPDFCSGILQVEDLVRNAAERVFGLAIDSTGMHVSAHGSQSYFAAVDAPFHLRLQGIYGDAGTGGAGIAYHPRANGNASPTCERLGFVADGAKAVHAVDVAYFIRRGRFELKHQLYGPLRVSRRLAGDDPGIILKLYGVSLTGGLTVIDLRSQDIVNVPGEATSPGC